MSIVVTAAAGHLGGLIVESLLSRGVPAERITATARGVERLQPLAERGVGIARLDYDEPDSIDAALAGADVVILVSGNEVGRRVVQHGHVIDAARRAGAGRVVYTSAPHADTTALVLAPEHRATEDLLLASGVPFTVTRHNWYTENYVPTFEQAKATGEILTSAGNGRVASATRADYAEGVAAVALDPSAAGRIFEFAGDAAWTFDDLASVFSEVIGRPVVHHPVTAAEHRQALLAAGLDAATADFVVALDKGIADGDLSDAPGTLSAVIGRPTTPLADTVRGWA